MNTVSGTGSGHAGGQELVDTVDVVGAGATGSDGATRTVRTRAAAR